MIYEPGISSTSNHSQCFIHLATGFILKLYKRCFCYIFFNGHKTHTNTKLHWKRGQIGSGDAASGRKKTYAKIHAHTLTHSHTCMMDLQTCWQCLFYFHRKWLLCMWKSWILAIYIFSSGVSHCNKYNHTSECNFCQLSIQNILHNVNFVGPFVESGARASTNFFFVGWNHVTHTYV